MPVLTNTVFVGEYFVFRQLLNHTLFPDSHWPDNKTKQSTDTYSSELHASYGNYHRCLFITGYVPFVLFIPLQSPHPTV